MSDSSSSISFDPASLTPMMQQWYQCKQQAKDYLLLFRMGDFYEAFYDDAVTLAKEIELTLTQRQGTPMSGIPHHACDGYIDKLIAKGYKVAIAEQTEDPKQAKGLVKREIVRKVTPGTLIHSNLLSENNNNFIASIVQTGQSFGFSYLDISTSEFYLLEFTSLTDLLTEIHRVKPSEFLLSERFYQQHERMLDELQLSYSFSVTKQEQWRFDPKTAHEFLKSHFNVHSLESFGIPEKNLGIIAAGSLLTHLKEKLFLSIDQIRKVKTYSIDVYVSLDKVSQRNLELTESLKDGSRKNTLLEVLDQTQTPMGGRLFRQWLKRPLLNIDAIKLRQKVLGAFFEQPVGMEKLRKALSGIRDLERLMIRITTSYTSPRDIATLGFSLRNLQEIKEVLKSFQSPIIDNSSEELELFPHLVELIENALVEEPPAKITDGQTFKIGYNKELDEWLSLKMQGKQWLNKYQENLRSETGIKTLKVGYNRVFGYYIEVSAGQANRMPDSFIRRQTLANNERFISPELKAYEEKVLHAEENTAAIENRLFQELKQIISSDSERIFRVSQVLAKIDCLLSLARVARSNDYVCPELDNSNQIIIQDGRHPVIEASYAKTNFIPNDVQLDEREQQLLIITGPNMAGKSTYIRQVALITIMAQMGSFVPAKMARIGIVDKIFTRIGASDDLSRGQSTFMVEMTETANILHNATSKSLVILDEIGRGTSTFDGISIAWSVAEYLLETPNQKARTLFATHYCELTKIEGMISGAVNYHVSVKEAGDKIIFTHKIARGPADKSYGIHVAELAGLPKRVISRSHEILEQLEQGKTANTPVIIKPAKTSTKRSTQERDDLDKQLAFF